MSLFINTAQQEGKNNFWLYLLGTIISFLGGQILGSIPLIILFIKTGNFNAAVLTNPALLGISNNMFLSLMLLPFITSAFLLWLFIRFAHKKRFIISFTPFGQFNWRKFFFSFGIWFAISIFVEFLSYLYNPSNYEFHYAGASFWILVLISVCLLPIQTGYEELLFRSYLMQGIGIRFHYRIIPFLITSVLFGLLHIANPEVKEYGYITMLSYVGIGLLLGLITLLSDSLELALGLHAANNIFSATLVGFKSSALTTDTLFYAKELKVDWASNLTLLAVMIVYFLIVRWKYKLLPIPTLWQRFEKPQAPSALDELLQG